MAEFQRVASVSDVREGDFLSVSLDDGQEILLVKANGQIFATQIMCTHQEAWLDSGLVHRDTMEIECPLHEGRFDMRTGEPTALPPTDPLRTYPVKIDGNDVYVEA